MANSTTSITTVTKKFHKNQIFTFFILVFSSFLNSNYPPQFYLDEYFCRFAFRYSSIYEDPYNYDKPEPAVVMRKKGPPPPIKPTARHSTIGGGGVVGGGSMLQRNFSADSILESVDGDAVVAKAPMPSRQEIGHRPTMQLSSSTSHLAAAGRQPAALKNQRPRSSGGLGLANYHQHWLVQVGNKYFW